MDEVDRLVWAVSKTYEVGGRPVRVRANTGDAARAVGSLLGPALVADDATLDHAWSIRLEPRTRGVQTLHALYAGCDPILRSRDPLRPLRLLVSRLGRDVELEAVVGPRGALLFPPQARRALATIERALNRSGIRLVDQPAAVDEHGDELIVPAAPSVDVDLRRLGIYVHAEPGPAGPGRYPVAGRIDEPVEDLVGAIVERVG